MQRPTASMHMPSVRRAKVASSIVGVNSGTGEPNITS